MLLGFVLSAWLAEGMQSVDATIQFKHLLLPMAMCYGLCAVLVGECLYRIDWYF